jgi:hypothetical protein
MVANVVAILFAGGAVEFSCIGCSGFDPWGSAVCLSAGKERGGPQGEEVGCMEGAAVWGRVGLWLAARRLNTDLR